jgi:lysophospholipase L1-like esterase
MRRPDPLPRRPRCRRATNALLATALAAAVALPAPAHARLVVLIGDSIMWGGTAAPTGEPVGQAATDPGRSLTALLALLPERSAWNDAEVVNLGVPGTNTRDWVEAVPEHICKSPNRIPNLSVLDVACERRIPLADAVAVVVDRTPDAILVQLGTNDVLKKIPPETTVENLAKLKDHLPKGGAIHIAAPVPPPAPPGTEFAAAVRQGLLDRGLLTGPDWPKLPTVDGIHFTEGGYAAAAGLWLDVLRKQTP